MHKFSYLKENEWVEHSHAPIFNETISDAGTKRILAAIPRSDPLPFQHLVLSLEPPYFLLYILHTPRGEGKSGRYQSQELTSEQVRNFIAKFGNYLSSDARFDIWAHSTSQNATVIWDRHNQLFAYGPLNQFTAELNALGFHQGITEIPTPHAHHYHPEFDGQAAELLSTFAWHWTPLKPEDEQ